MTINRERIKLLVAALRSPEFKQAIGALRSSRTPESYCCLGVACEVFKRNGGDGSWNWSERYGWDFLGAEVDLPGVVQTWYGIRGADPKFTSDFYQGRRVHNLSTLSSINDSGATFDDIADILENDPQFLGGKK